MMTSSTSRMTQSGRSNPRTSAATWSGAFSNARIQVYRPEKAVMIMTLALLMIDSRSIGGMWRSLSPW